MAPHPLDNPVWMALTGPQASLGITSGRFRRYRPDVGLFAAAEDPAAGFDGLADTLAQGLVVGLVTAKGVTLPQDIEQVDFDSVPQMVAQTLQPAKAAEIMPLKESHIPQMLELTALTKPGPFLPRTIDMGRYVGVFDGERLVAMAGERMRFDGFTEVSAVCTHPDYQGRGYGKALARAVAAGIAGRGETPFLHVRARNTVAIAAYERLGFAIRHHMHFTIVRRR